MRRKSAMTHEFRVAAGGAEGAAGALGWAWAAVKSKQHAAYQAQYGLFLTRMAITFNEHGLFQDEFISACGSIS